LQFSPETLVVVRRGRVHRQLQRLVQLRRHRLSDVEESGDEYDAGQVRPPALEGFRCAPRARGVVALAGDEQWRAPRVEPVEVDANELRGGLRVSSVGIEDVAVLG